MFANRRVVALVVVFLNISLNFAIGSDLNNNVGIEVVEIGEHKKSIYKCCPKNFVVFNEDCYKAPEGINLNFSDVDIYTNSIDKTGFSAKDVFQMEGLIVPINETSSHIADFFLTTDNLLIRSRIPNAVVRWKSIDRDYFCLDYEMLVDENRTRFEPRFRVYILIHQEEPFNANEYYIKAGALLVSCVFLLIVLLVYCILPELRNLAGKVLMAYAGSLLCAYALLATMIFETMRSDEEEPVTAMFCITLSSAIYFFFMASFFWMNVMSWDLWCAFRRLVDFRNPHRTTRSSTFLIYCSYAFGMSLGMTAMFVLLNEYPIPGVITPNIPLFGCFIDEPEKMLYFYVPMLILISCNWILFLLTAYNFWRYDRSIRILKKRSSCVPAKHHATRQRLIMYIKFSLLMGISFVLEATGSVAPKLSVWYITDMYNMLIGVAFFVIFVCKRRILRMLNNKLQLCWNKKGLRTSIDRTVNLQASKTSLYQYEMAEF